MNFLDALVPKAQKEQSLNTSLSPSTTKNQYQTPPSGKGKKLKLAQDDKQNLDELDPLILIKAINNSFTQRMSGHEQKINTNDILSIISQFAFTQCAQLNKTQDISIRQWCVVEVDEKFLQNSQIGTIGQTMNNVLSCGKHISNQQRTEYNIVNHIELPSSIRPYCLVLNMQSKQLHFQSHQQPNNHFFINFDTIPVILEHQSPVNYQILLSDHKMVQTFLNKPIVLKVDNKDSPLQIKMYTTSFTLPFPFNQTASQFQKYKCLLNIRQSLYGILDRSIKQSRGRQLRIKKILDLALKFSIKFYNSRYATEQQFAKYCESGDLLLFRDNHTFAKMQRVVTNSEYDHVGIVFRSEQAGLCLFQSNSGTGVGLASWRQLIRHKWFENIQKITWRKLQVHDRPTNFQEKINQFIKGNLHKQFGISLPKLLRFKSVTYTKDAHKSYFCSELVATLYKFLGLLDSQKSSSQYWPKDFADGNGIQILNGALDPQRQLIFEDALLKECYQGYYK